MFTLASCGGGGATEPPPPPPSTVTISSISPSPMAPGVSVIITGSGFSSTASGNTVTIDGQAATVTAATATQLTITVPSNLPCAPTHEANVKVSANGGSATGHQTIQVGTVRTIAVGATLLLENPADMNCTELAPSSGHYEAHVVNISEIPTSTAPFRFAGTTTGAAAAAGAAAPFTLRQSTLALRSTLPLAPADVARGTSLHMALLEFNRKLMQQMKPAFTRRALARRSSKLRSIVASVVAGERRNFRVFTVSTDLGAVGSCNTFTEVTARAVYVGTKGIIWEDINAPLAGKMDDRFIALGQEFDTSMYPSDRDNFADPLIADADLDNDGHLNMVFTPAISPQLAGFVVGCDYSPRSTNNQASNFGENFYARVPSVDAAGFSGDTPDNFMRTMRPTIVHEVKHIARFSVSFETDSDFEESWLEEGMAMTAEEVWSRNTQYPGATWKGNMTYDATISRDARPTQFPDAPVVMQDHFSRLYDYLDNQGATSLFGRVSDNDFVFYGASWSFIRYNVDRYAPSEAAYLQGITSSTSTGIANIAEQSGDTPSRIISNWSLALALDENPAFSANPDVLFPSWNLRSIYAGLNKDFPQQNNFPKIFPLRPTIVAGGDFSIDNTGIHGGSFAAYDLAGVAGTTRAIGVQSSTAGNPLPSTLRLVIARIQ